MGTQTQENAALDMWAGMALFSRNVSVCRSVDRLRNVGVYGIYGGAAVGFFGFVCWGWSFIFSINELRLGENRVSASFALIGSFIPLAFLAIAFWVASNGGV